MVYLGKESTRKANTAPQTKLMWLLLPTTNPKFFFGEKTNTRNDTTGEVDMMEGDVMAGRIRQKPL